MATRSISPDPDKFVPQVGDCMHQGTATRHEIPHGLGATAKQSKPYKAANDVKTIGPRMKQGGKK